jgi:hypothetical protein
MSGGWDELLKEAKGRLVEQEAEEEEASAELGEGVDLSEGETFVGRWRGYGTAPTKRGIVDVYLLWDTDKAKRFIWPKTRLEREISELQPNVGDEIAIVRGHDIPNSDPDRNPTQRYAVKVRSCEEPLPGDSPAAVERGDDIPF